MATIEAYDTKAGRRFMVRYRRPDMTETKKRGFVTKRDAQFWATSIESSKMEGNYIDPSEGKVTVTELGEHWLKTIRVKRGSKIAYETAFRLHVQPVFGGYPVNTVRKAKVREWVAELSGARAAQTVIRAHYVLQAILQLAVEDRRIPRNPARGLKNLPKKTRRKNVYLTYPQVEALAEAANDHRLHAYKNVYGDVIYFAAYVGLRWGEIASLTAADVDLEARRVTVRAEVSKNGEERTVGYPTFMHDMITARASKGQLFPKLRAPTSEVGNWFDTARKTANIRDGFVFHDLRHSAASFAISAGASVKVVQNMLGHASAVETLDTYSDLFDTDVDDVAARISEAREKSVPKMCPRPAEGAAGG